MYEVNPRKHKVIHKEIIGVERNSGTELFSEFGNFDNGEPKAT